MRATAKAARRLPCLCQDQRPNGNAEARREKGGVEVQLPTKLAMDTRLVPPWTDPCQSRDSGNQQGAKEIRLLPEVFAGIR